MRRQVTETRMWPLLVVHDSPLFDLSARVRQRYEQVLVEAFLAKAAVKRWYGPSPAFNGLAMGQGWIV